MGRLDAVVEAAQAAGLTPILDIVPPPAWAYDTPPDGVNGGSPNVADLGDFATALATHYDGLTPGRRPSTYSRSGTSRTSAST